MDLNLSTSYVLKFKFRTILRSGLKQNKKVKFSLK